MNILFVRIIINYLLKNIVQETVLNGFYNLFDVFVYVFIRVFQLINQINWF